MRESQNLVSAWGGSRRSRLVAAIPALCILAVGVAGCEDQMVDAGAGEVATIGYVRPDLSPGEGAVFSKGGQESVVGISPSGALLEAGATLQLVASDRHGNSLDAKWSGSNAGVATVSATGLLTGVSPGKVTVTAQTKGKPASADFTVIEPAAAPSPPARPGIPTITTAAVSADTFAVSARWAAASGATRYEWRTGANQTAWSTTGSVSDTTASLRAPHLSGASGYWFCVTAVNSAGSSDPACNSYAPPASAPAPVATVTVSPSTASLTVGGTQQLTATLRDASGNTLTGRTVTWSTSSSTVATVSASGLVTARAAGSATVTATSEGRGGSASISVTTSSTTPPPPSQGVLLRSDWNTALGNTNQAIGDGGRWPEFMCWPVYTEVLSVVPGSQAGWTATPNVLQVRNRGGGYCGQVENRTAVPQGRDFYVRMYVRVEDENQPNFHPVTLNCCGAIEASPWAIFNPVAGVSYRPKMNFTAQGLGNRRWWPSQPLPQRAWYRFEWHVEFVDAAQRTYRMWPRIYDMAGRLLYDADSYVDIDAASAGRTETLGDFYRRGGLGVFNSLDLARRFGLGYEGTGNATDQGRRWFYAAVEIRSDTWPGPVR
jgi:uncharacterized protein YjdB